MALYTQRPYHVPGKNDPQWLKSRHVIARSLGSQDRKRMIWATGQYGFLKASSEKRGRSSG